MFVVAPSSVKAFNIGFDERGNWSDDARVTALLNSIDKETGLSLVPGAEIIQAIVDACKARGLEYIADENLYAGSDDLPTLSLEDWIKIAPSVYCE